MFCATKDSARFISGFSRMADVCFVAFVLCLLSGVVYAADDEKALQDKQALYEQKAATIKYVHTTGTLIQYRPDGSSVTTKYETWMKAPNKWRYVSDDMLIVSNDKGRWNYSKKHNSYTLQVHKPEYRPQACYMHWYIFEEAVVGQEKWIVSGPKKVVRAGVECLMAEISLPAANEKAGPMSVTIYGDSQTGFITAKVTKYYMNDGTTLNTQVEEEYDYNKHEKPDEFFVFNVPDGAKEVGLPNPPSDPKKD